jgi:hypothetical protein
MMCWWMIRHHVHRRKILELGRVRVLICIRWTEFVSGTFSIPFAFMTAGTYAVEVILMVTGYLRSTEFVAESSQFES